MTGVAQIADRDLQFDPRDFQRIRTLMRSWVGISFSDSKESLVYNRLAKRLRAHGMERFCEYLDLVEEDEAERELFINSLTTNLTSFFREEHHFPILADYLQKVPRAQPINIWCSAASTGEEPYSIAMTVFETLGDVAARRVRIIASDLDTHVLAHAKAGVYRMAQVEKLGQQRLRRFFLKGGGRHDGFAKVKPELSEIITFQQINLLEPRWPINNPLDVIFCRNVMIYFDKAMQLKVLERFAPLLIPQGLLFAGHSESLNHAAHLFRLCGRTLYQRVEGAK